MYKSIIKPVKPYFLKEASFLSGSLQKVIINMVKVIKKRTGEIMIGDVNTVFSVKKPSGYYAGIKYYVGKRGTAIRFNWSIRQNSTLHSIDIFRKFKPYPSLTLDVENLNINQVIDVIVEYLQTGETEIAIDESDKSNRTKLNELKFGGLTALFKKAEKEIPEVETSTEEVVSQVKIKALTGTQVFQQIERYTETLMDSKSNENLLIIAGDPGTGKTEVVKEVLNRIGGTNIKPKLSVFPPVNTKQLKDLIARKSEEYGHPVSLQDLLIETSDQIKPFKSKWVLGSQDVTGKQLFIEMFQSNGNVLLYDDADTVFTVKENKLLLKQAMDTKPIREIKWASQTPFLDLGAKIGFIPKEFKYTGKMIIISNLKSGQIDPALKSRALFVNVELTPVQFMDRLKNLLPVIQKKEAPHIQIETFESVFNWLYNVFVVKKVVDKFDIRTYNALVKEMHILRGDFGLWESIAAIAIMQKYPGAKFQISEA